MSDAETLIADAYWNNLPEALRKKCSIHDLRTALNPALQVALAQLQQAEDRYQSAVHGHKEFRDVYRRTKEQKDEYLFELGEARTASRQHWELAQELMKEAEAKYELLAQEMVYEGNSVQWWHSKAKAYGRALDDAWDALNRAGVSQDGEKSVADGIRDLAAVMLEMGDPDYHRSPDGPWGPTD